jgi:hypothetical protein
VEHYGARHQNIFFYFVPGGGPGFGALWLPDTRILMTKMIVLLTPNL